MQTLKIQIEEDQDSFPLEVGTFNLFIGENGAGKTRLIRAIEDQFQGDVQSYNPELPDHTTIYYKIQNLNPREREELNHRALDLSKHFNIALMPNCCEGAWHVFDYLMLLLNPSPKELTIENFGSALNPMIVRNLIFHLYKMANVEKKRLFVTTHHPAALDGINLYDDEQRLFVVSLNDNGHTIVDRIRLKPEANTTRLKLSELWMRGHLGGLSMAF